MKDASLWDWNPGEKEIVACDACSGDCEWLEEPIASPDGEKVARVAKVRDDEEAIFTLAVNGELWESTFEKCWYPRFTPDGRLTALCSEMAEWTLVVDGEPWEEKYGFIWDTRFAADGDAISVSVQQDMEYGYSINGEAWGDFFENTNHPVLSPDGTKVASVVQTRNIPQADIFTFKEGCFSVAINGQPWDTTFVNCWDTAFDATGEHVAVTVRTSLYDYTIAVDGKAWSSRYQCMWEPRFNPKDGSVVAGARQGGKWGMLKDDAWIWKPTMFQCWKPAFSADGANLWAVVCPDFGRWTAAVNGDVWGEKFKQVVSDMTVSPDGKRAAIIGKTDDQWGIIVDDTRWVGWFEMAYPAVFSPDSKHVGYAVERKGGQMTIILDGHAYHKDFDKVWSPVFSPDSQKVMIRCLDGGVYKRIVVPISDF